MQNNILFYIITPVRRNEPNRCFAAQSLKKISTEEPAHSREGSKPTAADRVWRCYRPWLLNPSKVIHSNARIVELANSHDPNVREVSRCSNLCRCVSYIILGAGRGREATNVIFHVGLTSAHPRLSKQHIVQHCSIGAPACLHIYVYITSTGCSDTRKLAQTPQTQPAYLGDSNRVSGE